MTPPWPSGPWHVAQPKWAPCSGESVGRNSERPRDDRLAVELVDGAGLAARLVEPVDERADGGDDEQHERPAEGALEATALEGVVVEVGLAVGRELDLRAQGLVGFTVAERDDEVDEHRHDGGGADEPASALDGAGDEQAFDLKRRHAQCGPSASCPVVLVPMGGPWVRAPVSTVTTPPSTATAKRSRPRGAGPAFFSPTRLYLRAVARALEPLRRLAPRHPAAQVDALLVERDDAALHALEHAAGVGRLGLAQRRLRVGHDVEAALGDVERLLGVGDVPEDVVELAGTDLRAEAAAAASARGRRCWSAPKPARPRAKKATMPRLKNWRRVTP